jgi:hypothetical protein
MLKAIPFAASAIAFSISAIAQDFIGFSYNSAVGATSRGSVGTAAGEVMTRLDGSEHAGWGLGTAGSRTITSLFFVVQDQNAAASPETVDVVLYPEDPANPNFPDLTAGVVFATGVPGPTTGTIAAVVQIITPTTPVSVPITGGGDIFVSFVLPASAGWPATDGASIHVVLGYAPAPTFLTFDTPGLAQGGTPPPAGSPADSHGLARVGAGAAVYNARRHMFLDVAHGTSGGVGLAITNQTSYTASNNPPPAGFGPAPGTADFMSGSNPDVVGGNPGRVDDITMEYFRTGIGTGALVVFLMSFDASFGPEVPLSTFVAGSTGVLCLNPGAQTLGIAFTATDEAFLTTTIPAGLRPFLIGMPVKQQAAAFDPVLFVLHGSPCDSMTF